MHDLSNIDTVIVIYLTLKDMDIEKRREKKKRHKSTCTVKLAKRIGYLTKKKRRASVASKSKLVLTYPLISFT